MYTKHRFLCVFFYKSEKSTKRRSLEHSRTLTGHWEHAGTWVWASGVATAIPRGSASRMLDLNGRRNIIKIQQKSTEIIKMQWKSMRINGNQWKFIVSAVLPCESIAAQAARAASASHVNGPWCLFAHPCQSPMSPEATERSESRESTF